MVVLIDANYHGVYLQDLKSGYSRVLSAPGGRLGTFVSWARGGCDLVLSPVFVMSGNVIRGNLSMDSYETVASFDFSSSNGVLTGASMSSTNRWISYVVGTGERLPERYEDQDLYTADLDAKRPPRRLTLEGGLSAVAWSPTEPRIAFAARDSSGVVQLFVAEADGTNSIQLTDFDDQLATITAVLWSPSGRALAFTQELGGPKAKLLVLDLTSDRRLPRSLYQADLISNIWWQDNDRLALYANPSGFGLGGKGGGIYTIAADSGTVLGSVPESASPDGYFELPGVLQAPFAFGFLGPSGFFGFDPSAREVRRLAPRFAEVRAWIESPPTYPGEEACRH